MKHSCTVWLRLNWAVVILTHSILQDGWTPLRSASSKGHHSVVELLLGAGANPDLQNKVGAGSWFIALLLMSILSTCFACFSCALWEIYLYLVLNMPHTLTVPLLLGNIQYALVAPCYVSCKHPVLLCWYDYRYLCVYVLNMLIQYQIRYRSWSSKNLP